MNFRTKSSASKDITRSFRKISSRMRIIAIPLLILIGSSLSFAADWTPLAERLSADGFNRQVVEGLFARPEVLFEPDAMTGKLKALLRSREAAKGSLPAIPRTAVYRDYLNSWVISLARLYIVENNAVLEKISTRYGVPKEIVVSILLIETHLGQKTGTRCVFNRLASMARCTDLEILRPYLGADLITPDNEAFARRRCREKADWAYNELKALLRLAERDSIDPLEIRGSIYGAIGLCQFMPSNVFAYGVDADQDGRIDPFAKPDALHSIANYLHRNGWREGLDREGQHRVIFRYNQSTVYANTILAVAEKIRNGGFTPPPQSIVPSAEAATITDLLGQQDKQPPSEQPALPKSTVP
jgi:membrane-bound lytic murein transglycosylase B